MAFQRSKRLTRKEKQSLNGSGPKPPMRASTFPSRGIELEPGLNDEAHIHCIACGRHLDTAGDLRARGGAARPGETPWTTVRCAHGSAFQSCVGCIGVAQTLLIEHDRSGAAVKTATAWH